MHQIDTDITDFLLPAIRAFPTALKFVERHLADETNDFRLVRLNNFQCSADPLLFLALFHLSHIDRGPVHQIHEIQRVFRNKFFVVNVLQYHLDRTRRYRSRM